MSNLGRAWVAALWLSAAAAGGSGPVHAGVGIDVTIAPPAPRVEVVPAPRRGFVWEPGFWAYRRGTHVWVPGRWIAERRGWHWVPERWVPAGPRWHFERGHWER